MKRKNIFLTLCLSLLCLSGCNKKSNTQTQLNNPTNFTMDFEKSEYSFTGSENATFYSLKVYQYVNDVLDSHAVSSSGMIKANEENTYKGTIDYSFTAGKYRAVLKAIAPRYKSSEITCEGDSKLLGTPTVKATWKEPTSNQQGPSFGLANYLNYRAAAETENEGLSIDVDITAGDLITKDYTVSVTNKTLGVEVYKNEKVEAGTLNLKYADLHSITELTDDDDYSVTVCGNAFDDYKANSEVTTNVVSSGSGFTFKISKFSFDKGAKEITFNLGKTETMMGATGTLLDTPSEGSLYTYNVMKKTGLPFNLEGTLDIKNDNTVVLFMESVGPVQGGTFKGTWSEENGKIQISKLVQE